MIRFRPHLVGTSHLYLNPPSPNERLSDGYRIADIKASAHASHKTHACISLKQRSYSRNYGLVCNLGKQMAERQRVHLLLYPLLIIKYSYYIEYSRLQFITIRRIMVSNMVSNWLRGHVPPHPLGMPYTALT